MHDPETIRAEMEAQNVTISEMSRSGGLSRPTVQRALRGDRIDFETLAKIAKRLDKPLAFFLADASSGSYTPITAS